METIKYYSLDHEGFVLDGLGFSEKNGELFRLPPGVFISGRVNELAANPAGVMLRFRTNSSRVKVRAKFRYTCDSNADHMTLTGSQGFDLYVGAGTNKVFAGVTRFGFGVSEYDSTLMDRSDRKGIMEEYTLHFPLYSSVTEFALGLDADARIEKPSPWKDPRPIVVYGTSIQQGGCASRPGMCHTSIMSRMLDRPFINLAFSGAAKGERAMAEVLASIKDAAMFVLDYDANAHAEGLEKTLRPFIDTLRTSHKKTPILLVSSTPRHTEFLPGTPGREMRAGLTKIHTTVLAEYKTAGDDDLYFLDGSTLYGKYASECTVDGVHATDLGFYLMAENMGKVIAQILG